MEIYPEFSLVESFIVMLRQLSYDIKNQLKAPIISDLIEIAFIEIEISLYHRPGAWAMS